MQKFYIILIALLCAFSANAQTYKCAGVVEGPGRAMSGGGYRLVGSAIQPVTGVSTSGTNKVYSGFWFMYRQMLPGTPNVSYDSKSSLTTTSVTFNATIANQGDSPVTESGIVISASSNPLIDGNGVIKIASSPLVASGAYVIPVASLTANTLYYVKAYAINTQGVGYSSETSFYTLSEQPAAPSLTNPTSAGFDVAIASGDGNPNTTEYAISIDGNYLQLDGSLGAVAAWATKTNWGTKTLTGLNPNTSHYSVVASRNGDHLESSNSVSSWKNTLSAVPAVSTISDITTNSFKVAVGVGDNTVNTTQYAIRIGTKYVQTDGTLGDNKAWATAAVWGGVTVSGLSVNTSYTVDAASRNADQIETAFGPSVSKYTLANAPDKPTISSITSSSANIAIATTDGNPNTTKYSIRVGSNFVQTDGSLAVGEVWATASTWGEKTISGLNAFQVYNVYVRAQNGDNVPTSEYQTVFTTLKAEPVNYPTLFAARNPQKSSIDLTWTQNATNPDGYVVIASEVSYNDIVAPTDGVAAVTAGLVKVLTNVGSTTFSGLKSNTQYYFKIFPFNGSGEQVNYKTGPVVPETTATTLISSPSLQASSIRFSNITRTSITVKWTNGDGDARALFVKNNKFASAPLIDGVKYTANPVFGSGSMVDNGAYCVYNNTGSSVDISGLNKYKLYYFRVFEYNDLDSPNYLQEQTASNPASRWTLRRDGVENGDFVEAPFDIYPNPSSDLININLNLTDNSSVSMNLFASDGSLAKQINYGSALSGEHLLQANVQDLSSGVYLLQLNVNGEILTSIVEIVK
jgi:hypothetical protein